MALYLPADTPRRMALLPSDLQKTVVCEAIYERLTTLGLTPPPARTPYKLLAPPADPVNGDGWNKPFGTFLAWVASIGAGDSAEIEICYRILSTVGYSPAIAKPAGAI